MNLSDIEEDYVNCTSPFDSYEFTKVVIVSKVAACLSFLASASVIALCIILKKWKCVSDRLVIYLVITTLLVSTATMLRKIDLYNQNTDFHTEFCKFAGFLVQVTAWMFINAIFTITIHVFIVAFLDKRPTAKHEWVYIVWIFVVPFLVNLIPLIHASYGKAGVWCWIRASDPVTCEVFVFGMWLQYTLLYVPSYLFLILMTMLYVAIIIKIRRERKRLKNTNNFHLKHKVTMLEREIIPLLTYPLVYLILGSPQIINRIHISLVPNKPNVALWYLSALSSSVVGIFTTLAFVLGTETRRELKWKNIRANVFKKKKKVSEYPMRSSETTDSWSGPGSDMVHSNYTRIIRDVMFK